MLPSSPLYKTNLSEIDTTRYILMFGTGFLDKNKKEIYCGDKVLVNNKVHEVFFVLGSFSLKGEHHKDWYCFDPEIVGNIYQAMN